MRITLDSKYRPFIERWVEALRSGDYKQGHGQLYNEEEDEYCCLGVMCDVACRSSITDLPANWEEHPYPLSLLEEFDSGEFDSDIPEVLTDGDYATELAIMNDYCVSLDKTVKKPDLVVSSMIEEGLIPKCTGRYSFHDIADFIEVSITYAHVHHQNPDEYGDAEISG